MRLTPVLSGYIYIYVGRPFNDCNGVRRWHTNKNYSEGVAIIAIGGWRCKPLHGKLIGWELGRHDDITIPRFIAARRPSGRRLLLIFFFFFFLFFSVLRNRWDDALRIRELEGRKKWTAENFFILLFFFTRIFHSIRKIIRRFLLRFFFSFAFSYYFSYANEGIAFVFSASLLCIKTKVFVLKASSLFFTVFSFNYLGFYNYNIRMEVWMMLFFLFSVFILFYWSSRIRMEKNTWEFLLLFFFLRFF